MPLKRSLSLLFSSVLLCSSSALPGLSAPHDSGRIADPFDYLEDIEGGPALDWVSEQNAKTLQRLSQDKRLKETEAVLTQSLTDLRTIALPEFADDNSIDTFLIDSVHVRGQWRRTSRTSYDSGDPQWNTILDVDALAKQEKRNWVYQGRDCLPSHPDRCLVMLSDGGRDAVFIREYDAARRQFVADGFILPEAKQTARWFDKDTIYVSREWTPGEVTTSGYGYVTRRLRRGQSLDQAVEICRGERTDVTAICSAWWDQDGRYVADIHIRELQNNEAKLAVRTQGAEISLPLPLSARMETIRDGQMIVRLNEPWETTAGKKFSADSVISLDLEKALKNPQAADPVLVFAPSTGQSVENVSETANFLIIHTLTNVMGELHALHFAEGAWHARKLPLADNLSVSVVSADDHSDALFVTTESFLSPRSLFRVDAATLEVQHLASEDNDFVADDMEVSQNWVTSKDGTKVPYFLVSKKDMKRDGSNPTLLTAYGGFEVSSLPFYSGTMGKIWLEQGGVFVLANIRGGREFGSQWHVAGLKTRRQVIFDDFQAVAEDLIRRKITSPKKLGIRGGSNGGLLMGVQLVQRPELWGAMIIDVPLLDMVRYNKLFAGASWTGEYGDPDDPVEGMFLRSISPYHNLKAGTVYPEPFFTTSTLDDRVHPSHARKMAARMQSLNMPFLFYESSDGGHATAATTADAIRIEAMKHVYLVQKLMD